MIHIDSNAFSKSKVGYTECANRMRALKRDLEKAVDGLRVGWDTNAGDKFFEKYDDSWVKNISDYINVIEHMSNNMGIANEMYTTVFDEAKKLSF